MLVGIDVGATKVDACLVDPVTGAMCAHERVPTCPERGSEAVLTGCVNLARRVAGPARVESIGVGVCECVDDDGRIVSASTLDWRAVDVAGAFSDIAPATVESDVRAAAVAEARCGAGVGLHSPWVYVTVGTGIAYALVVDGVPFRGAHGGALVVGAPAVERVASGHALQALSGHSRAEEVLQDPDCAPLVAEAASALGFALAAVVNALDPCLVVIGGGLGLVSTYRDRAVAAMRTAIELEPAREVPVVPACLGEVAGAIGAAIVGSPAHVATSGWRRGDSL